MSQNEGGAETRRTFLLF